MKVEDSVTKTATNDSEQFSIVLGGPVYRFAVWLGLTKPPVHLLRRRIIAAVMITWFPLLLLTMIEGTAFGGVKVPFLQHIAVHARFLLTLPLLLAAEVIAHKRLKGTVKNFIDRNLIAPEDIPRFKNAIASSIRMRNSVLIEVILFVVSWTIGYWYWEHDALKTISWFNNEEGARHYTKAGIWYVFVSLPILRFIILRWFFRLCIWYRFLWQLSRIPLRLNAMNPDHAGGLGFLQYTPFALYPALVAYTIYIAGKIADHILHEGATLPQFKIEILTIITGLTLLGFLPLTLFIFQLNKARQAGRKEFGDLSSRYANDFRQKWAQEGMDSEKELLLGTADIQSLADLANSSEVVSEMRLVPFKVKSLLRFAILLAVPLMPLALTMIPLNEIVDRALKMLL